MLEQFAKHNYLLFSTLKRNGDYVATPVWFAQQGSSFYLFSAGDAGKVKRLRNFSEAKITPCAMLGEPRGEDVAAKAYLLDDESEIKLAHKLLVKTYGWQMRLLDIGSTLAGRKKTRKYIRVDVTT